MESDTFDAGIRAVSHSRTDCTTSRVAKYEHVFNPLNAELNPICHLLALLGAHHILHISRKRVKITQNAL